VKHDKTSLHYHKSTCRWQNLAEKMLIVKIYFANKHCF